MRLRLLLPSALVVLVTGQAAAQAGKVSTAQVITLAAVKPGQLTLAVTAGAVQSLPTLTDNAVNVFPTPVTIQTEWDVNPGKTGTVNVVGWFSSPAQALVNGSTGTPIPSSMMKGRMLTGAVPAFTAFTQNGVGGVGSAGGSLRLLNLTITGTNKKVTRTDNLDLEIDLTGAAVLPIGTYSGTLNLEAITQ
ncbi:MAG TPA: hypothetical protein VFW66_06855 [Gemmatimonadales bacterium]|nr:hypothetical protein [Gemmatimonadales bacterium]